MLKDKKILLAVCGSISFYKAYEILSMLKKLGADVYVALSDGALKFCSVIGWEALTPHAVLNSQTENWQAGVNHINYAKMDLILIAPASVNTINKLANGICDNIFMQTLIASEAPLLIAPAANHKMLAHFSTQTSIKFLRENGAKIIDPVEKILACGDTGKGGLADIEMIIYEVKRALCKQKFQGRKVIITGGATTERIDDVRAITNYSSGKMAHALADAFYCTGAEVMLCASFEVKNTPYKVVKFNNSKELLDICLKYGKNADILVMCAAVSDYICAQKFSGKLKKSELGKNFSLKLTQNIDILTNLKELKCKKIGFKLETNERNSIKTAQDMLLQKSLDAVCLNVIGVQNNFGSDQNEIKFITKNNIINLELENKENLAIKIANLVSDL